MSLVMEILEDLWNAELNYKGARVNFFGIPKFLIPDKKPDRNTISSTLSRLSNKGLATSDGKGGWILTEKGKEYFLHKNKNLRNFFTPVQKKINRNLMIMFDIPETKSKERYWLREHLRRFQFIMIQKSVWVGPNPLPKDFSKYLKEIGLEKHMKKFKLAKSYIK